jgi:hypothetical protein
MLVFPRHALMVACLVGGIGTAPAALAQAGRTWVDPPSTSELPPPATMGSTAPVAQEPKLSVPPRAETAPAEAAPARQEQRLARSENSRVETGRKLRRTAHLRSRSPGPPGGLIASLFGPPRRGANMITTSRLR